MTTTIELGPLGGQFLPEKHEDRLVYLTRFVRESGLSPFTKEQESVIKLAEKTANATRNWLKLGIWGTTFLSTVPLMIQWAQGNSESAFYLSLGLTATVNVLNFVATGTAPDKSATAKAESEYQIEEAIETYKEISCRLIELDKTDHLQAKGIAEQWDVPAIQQSMEKLVVAKTAQIFYDHLQYARTYVLNGKLDEEAPLSIRLTVRSPM